MNPLLLGAIVGLAAFGAGTAVLSAAAPVLFRSVDARRARLPAAAAARWLFAVRALPAAGASALALGLVVPAFVLYEPPGTAETAGAVLIGFAALAAGLLVRGAVRAWRSYRASAALVAAWMASARRVQLEGVAIPAYRLESEFPLVAVAGLWRPRLLVAGSVLDTCTARELALVLAHEQAHVRARDNLRRLLLDAAPDLLSGTASGSAMLRSWHQAAEEAADERALAGASRAAACDLAGALIKVARLAPAACPLPLPASAFFRGESLERRVRRLLAWSPPRSQDSSRLRQLAAAASAGALAAAALVLDLLVAVHKVTEQLVAVLP
jgi:beta-lactamase regulating signal transducer with metallopeptidase domain